MGKTDRTHVDREHLTRLDTFEMKFLRRQLNQEIDDITGQIEMAVAEAETIETKLSIDPIWKAKAEHARRCKQRDVEVIDEILQERSQKAELHARQTYAATFVNVARRRLPPLLLEEIDLQARTEMEKPEVADEYDKRIKRRKQFVKNARQQSELRVEQTSTKPQKSIEGRTAYLTAAEQVCASAQELVQLWVAGESIDIQYFERLASDVDKWEFHNG